MDTLDIEPGAAWAVPDKRCDCVVQVKNTSNKLPAIAAKRYETEEQLLRLFHKIVRAMSIDWSCDKAGTDPMNTDVMLNYCGGELFVSLHGHKHCDDTCKLFAAVEDLREYIDDHQCGLCFPDLSFLSSILAGHFHPIILDEEDAFEDTVCDDAFGTIHIGHFGAPSE